MHKTIYIDVDEEITSIVDRMRGANSDQVVISVPKRALLIQSILNLKILKKEAERIGISVAIVTQDKLGRLLVDKAGIELAQNVEDNYQEIPNQGLSSNENSSRNEMPKGTLNHKEDIRDRIESIGSDNFYEAGIPKSPSVSQRIDDWPIKDEGREKITNQELVEGIGKEKIDLDGKKKFIGIDSTIPVPAALPSAQAASKDFFTVSDRESHSNIATHYNENEKSRSERPLQADKKVENFFKHVDAEKAEINTHRGSNRGKRIFLFLLYLMLAAAILIAAYITIPKAKIILYVEPSVSKSIEDEIEVDVNFSEIDYEKGIIPGKVINTSSEISKNFPTSGSKNISNQKSHGTIAIYNEFGPDPQPLVATTRFETEDGKIFRLKKGITIPGMTKVGDETKPGVIEAEVEADKPGAEYDIGPSNFTIPGFKSNKAKFEKIYGKSTKAMTGGKSSSSDAKSLTQEDIDSAKKAAVLEVKESVKSKLKQEVPQGMVFLDEAVNFDEATFKLSNSPGDVVDNFELRVEMKASAVIFSEIDMKNIMARVISRVEDLKVSIDGSSIFVEYKSIRPDIKMGKLTINVSGLNKSMVNLDQEKIKKDLLGESNQALEEYFRSFPEIIKIEVNYFPTFLNQRIPFWGKRVEIEVREALR